MQGETKALVERLKTHFDKVGWVQTSPTYGLVHDAAHTIETQATQIATLGKALAEANAALELAGDERDLFRAQLAYAVRLLQEAHAWDKCSAMPAYSLGAEISAFIAIHKQGIAP